MLERGTISLVPDSGLLGPRPVLSRPMIPRAGSASPARCRPPRARRRPAVAGVTVLLALVAAATSLAAGAGTPLYPGLGSGSATPGPASSAAADRGPELASGPLAVTPVELFCAPGIPTAKLSIQLAWQGGDCLPGAPGQPANLLGFAFPFVNDVSAGDISRVRIFFIGPTTPSFNLYLWSDTGGLPDDQCGTELYKLLHAPIQGDSVYSEYVIDPPIAMDLGQKVWVGAVYEFASIPPTWYVGRFSEPSQPGRAFANITGDHGDWFDLDDFEYGQCYGVQLVLEVNSPPVAVAGGPYCGRSGDPVVFDGSGSFDPDGDALAYVWDFGDGFTATGVSPTHAFAGAGSYLVTLTVSDGSAASIDSTVAEIDLPFGVQVPGDMSLSAALALAARCAVDTIFVAPGQYSGPFTLANSDAVILAVGGTQETVLASATDSVPVVSLLSGNPTISGFTVSGGGPGIRAETAATIRDCAIVVCGGTGIEIAAAEGARIAGCVVARNGVQVPAGGGIELMGTHVVERTTVHENPSFALRMRAFSGETPSPTIDRALLTGTLAGPALVCEDGAMPLVSCSDIWGNAGGNAICGVNAGDNFSLDPLYCDAAAGDLSLRADSPCLNYAACGTVGALGVGCSLAESRIEGRVSTASGPLGNTPMRALDPQTGATVASTATGTDGRYAFTALTGGSYVIEAAPAGTFYVGEYYPDLPSPMPGNLLLATRITVNGVQTVTGIDFVLVLGGKIRGRVVDETSGEPLTGIHVHPFVFGGDWLRDTTTDANGVYESVAFPPGRYGALSPGDEGHFGEVYRERRTPAEGDTIYVFAGQRVLGIDFTLLPGATAVPDEEAPSASSPILEAPAPNPFNPSTRIRFTLPAAGPIRLDVFDIRGRHVRQLLAGVLGPGTVVVTWDGRSSSGRRVSSGIYLIRLAAGGRTLTREVVLVR